MTSNLQYLRSETEDIGLFYFIIILQHEIIYIPEKMANPFPEVTEPNCRLPSPTMEEGKVTIKEEIPAEEETCSVYIQEDDVKTEIKEFQGMFGKSVSEKRRLCSKNSCPNSGRKLLFTPDHRFPTERHILII